MNKFCPNCNHKLPESEFYVRNLSPDGLSRLCKSHQREYSKAHYDSQRGREILRKGSILSRPDPKDLVLRAIQHGAQSQEAIKRVTRLHPDEICDAIALLYDANLLNRVAIRQRRYEAA
jgi:hypothetical protein